MIKLLAKANDDVLSHCKCSTPLASIPMQLDCPWCGCGWLICCTQCRRAFTYARVVEVDTDYQTFIEGDRRRGKLSDFDPEELRDCALWLEDALADIPVGQTVAYLDGMYFELHSELGLFEGLYATHELEHLPHFIALTEPQHLRATLGEPSYWLQRASADTTVDP
jgi:hypothetical protein